LFLDTSVLLSASGSDKGASREIFRLAKSNKWTLIATPYVLQEVAKNLPKRSTAALPSWLLLRDRPAIFGPAKDRPILFSALAWTDVLLTRDHSDFGHQLGHEFYGLAILQPGDFLRRERAAGRI
jgi:predicted nucleic acid-binding protein